jgi:hypothetical protein
MHSLCFTSETSSNGVVERDFTVGEVPGVLWSPASGSGGAPLVLMGHGGGLHKKTPALMARARTPIPVSQRVLKSPFLIRYFVL